MNIYEALKPIDWKKAEYFKWKHDIRFKQNAPKKSEEDFLNYVNRKSLNGFIKWEKTDEYKALLLLYLSDRTTSDLHEVYEKALEKAKEGEGINDFMKLMKEIKLAATQISPLMKQDEPEEDDELFVD
ncbi:hypothetical protein ACQKJC_24695 [Priestia koreensis]|uniref:hypothetical protein n=1 Tax=Priestia koreensis TaxID=284581 RepID=UPI003D00CB61